MEEEEAAHSLGCPRGGQIVELENESQQNQIRPSFFVGNYLFEGG